MAVKNLIFLMAVAILIISGVALAGARAEENAFFSTLADVPLMPGLYELSGEAVIFDKPEGRISESVAVTKTVQAGEIRAFYAQTLPQLGWQARGQGVYAREDEILTMDIRRAQDMNILRISVTPGGR